MVGIKIDNVTKRFGDVAAVDSASIEIAKGELFFLLGPSGCGKTTLLRLIAGFHAPDEGRIWFDDRPIDDVPAHKRNTAMVFQNYALWPHMTVAENVAYGLDVRRVPAQEKSERVAKALDIVRMAGLGERKPNQLSGGQQQRVALARALVIEPDAILLDEPLSNLDAKLRIEMREEIRRIHRQTGITTVYVTHDQKEALSMAQRMAVMRDGRIEQVGAPRAVYGKPRNAFVAQFIGEINFIEGTLVGPGVVDTPLGRITTTPREGGAQKPQPGAPALATGDAVLCAVRPEAVRVEPASGSADGAEAAAPGANAFAAKVETQTYLGEIEQYMLRAAGGIELKALMVNPKVGVAPAAEGAIVRFDPEDVVVLKAEPTRD